MTWPSWVSRLIRYGIVGGTGVFVNFAVLKVVWPALHGLPALANATATEAAIVSNYFLNSRFTFGVRPRWSTGLRYNLVSIAGGALQVGAFTLLVHWGVYYLLANLLAIPLNTLVGFLLSLKWAFKEPTTDAGHLAEASLRRR